MHLVRSKIHKLNNDPPECGSIWKWGRRRRDEFRRGHAGAGGGPLPARGMWGTDVWAAALVPGRAARHRVLHARPRAAPLSAPTPTPRGRRSRYSHFTGEKGEEQRAGDLPVFARLSPRLSQHDPLVFPPGGGGGGHTAPAVPWVTAGVEDTGPGPNSVEQKRCAERRVTPGNEESLAGEKRTPGLSLRDPGDHRALTEQGGRATAALI